MVERGETGTAQITERPVAGLHPVAAPLESVAGQVEVGGRRRRGAGVGQSTAMPAQWAAASNRRNWSASSTVRRDAATTSERDTTSSVRVWRVSAVSTASGPTSTNRRTPASASDRTAGANRTASRTCRTQYCGVSSSGPIGAPDTVEHTPIRGAWYATEAATCSYSASIGSINAEWKA